MNKRVFVNYFLLKRRRKKLEDENEIEVLSIKVSMKIHKRKKPEMLVCIAFQAFDLYHVRDSNP